MHALTDGLKQFGWIEGRNLRMERRFAEGDPDRIRVLAAELAALAPDVIVGSGAPVTTALRFATQATPIVFVQVSDPVGAGIVPSLADQREMLQGSPILNTGWWANGLMF